MDKKNQPEDPGIELATLASPEDVDLDKSFASENDDTQAESLTLLHSPTNAEAPSDKHVGPSLHKDEYNGNGTPEETEPMVPDNDNTLTRRNSYTHALGSDVNPEAIELQDLSLPDLPPPSYSEVVRDAPDANRLERGESPVSSTCPSDAGMVERFFYIFKKTLTKRPLLFVGFIVALIGILLTLSLVPPSFVYVEYYELALVKNKVTGKVDRDNVYHFGCHLLTPSFTLLRFKACAHEIQQSLQVRTFDQLTVTLRFALQYFIVPDELGALFTDYEYGYNDIIEKVVETTIKNEAVQFTMDDYRHNRRNIEFELEEAVHQRLKVYHVDARYFQLFAMELPESLANNYIKKSILLVEAEEAVFKQESDLIKKRTQKDVQKILNQAHEIRENASTQASKVVSDAQSEADKLVQLAYVDSMKKFFTSLNVTKEDHKLSLMYVMGLKDISDNIYNLDFEKLSAA